MIVQTASEGAPHFVVRMADHTAVAGQLAAAFGNDRFDALEPRELMETVVTHHDAGWDELDALVLQIPHYRLGSAKEVRSVQATTRGQNGRFYITGN